MINKFRVSLIKKTLNLQTIKKKQTNILYQDKNLWASKLFIYIYKLSIVNYHIYYNVVN